MKAHILNYEPDRRGGGWTQARYLHEGLGGVSLAEADTVIITGPTMASYEDVDDAKELGKKIVLRVDNAVRDSRNRGTGMSRMKAFCDVADLVIYQSNWAREFLLPFTKKDGPVILNGVDTSVYNDKDRTQSTVDTYLYARSSRDEGKQWIMAWYWFVNNPGQLEIVGKFSGENLQYNFDFYNDERFVFSGELHSLVDAYKRNKYFLYTYLNDACSNTAIEALASGCEIIDCYGMAKTGGMPEILEAWNKDPKLLSLDIMIENYSNAIKNIL